MSADEQSFDETIAQTRRLLHQEQGGLVSLRSVVRMVDVLGLQVSIQLSAKKED